MNKPWEGKTGLAKAAAALATVLLVSLGLCGLNFLGATTILPVTNMNGGLTGIFIVGAYIETAAMTLSAAGLLIVGMIFAMQTAGRALRGRIEKDGEE